MTHVPPFVTEQCDVPEVTVRSGPELDELDELEPQIVKPAPVTEPSVYHVIVSPELMLTPFGPEEPA